MPRSRAGRPARRCSPRPGSPVSTATTSSATSATAHPDWPEAGIDGTLANFEVRPDGTIAPWLTYDRHIAVLRGLWDHRPSEIYARVATPVLLAPADTGADERARQKREGVDLAAASLPNARVRWFTGDHDIHAQHPDELADVMIDLVAEGFFG